MTGLGLKQNNDLSVSILIIALVTFLGILNLRSTIEKQKIAAVKTNMQIFQESVEIYAKNNKGKYPESNIILIKEATSKGYWKNFKNPFLKIENTVNDLKYIPESTILNKNTLSSGFIGYYTNEKRTKYIIYGVGKTDNNLIEDGAVYYLTNN